MSRMHKPVPKPAPNKLVREALEGLEGQDEKPQKEDKRSVIPLDPSDFDQWLEGTVDQARGLMRLAPTEVYDAGPVEPEQKALI